METNKTVQFVYNFQNFDDQPTRIEYPVLLPYRGDIRELSHEVVSQQMDPIMKMLDAHEGDKLYSVKGRQRIKLIKKNFICRIVQTFEDLRGEREPRLLQQS